MELLKPYFGKTVDIDVISDKKISGLLIDVGLDYMVLNKENKYFYLPLNHIQTVESSLESQISGGGSPKWKADEKLFGSLLQLAKNGLTELYITGQLPLYGKIVEVKDDYIVFYTLRHGLSYIPIFHIKWISPAFASGFVPDHDDLTAAPPFKATWRAQLETCLGHIVVFDLGVRSIQIGHLKTIENEMIELITPDGASRCWNIAHLKSVHIPRMAAKLDI